MPLSRKEIKARFLANRRANGICYNCPKPTVDGRVFCPSCKARDKQRDRERAAGIGSVPLDKDSALLTGAQITEAATAFKAGRKLRDLAVELGVSFNALARIFRSRGVSVERPSGQISRVRADVFADAETNPETAYYVGLLMADGSVSDTTTISIGLKESDRAVIDRFNVFLGGQLAVRVKDRGAGAHGKTRSASLSFRHKVGSETLARWGVTPRKTETAAVSSELSHNRDFWRGMIDGDGTLAIRNRGYPWLGLCGTETICAAFAEFIRLHTPSWKGGVCATGHHFLKTAGVCGRHAKIIARVLYADAVVAMERKAALAARAMAWEPQRVRTD